jgi:hypothetical protein
VQPPDHRLLESSGRDRSDDVEFLRRLFMRRKPRKVERDSLTFCNRKTGDRVEVLAFERDPRSKEQTIRTADGGNAVRHTPDPGHYASVVEADREFGVPSRLMSAAVSQSPISA